MRVQVMEIPLDVPGGVYLLWNDVFSSNKNCLTQKTNNLHKYSIRKQLLLGKEKKTIDPYI